MAPPESVPRIQDSDEFAAEAAKLGQSGCPILLQVGSEACVKCPAFTEAVAEVSAADEMCENTVADCSAAAGYVEGDVGTPSTTCPADCTLTHAVAESNQKHPSGCVQLCCTA